MARKKLEEMTLPELNETLSWYESRIKYLKYLIMIATEVK